MTQSDVVDAFEDEVVRQNYQTAGKLALCNHEEANSHVFLHANDMGKCGIDRLMIKTVDTDVLVLAIALFPKLNLRELWIDFGSRQNQYYCLVHTIC